MDVFNLRRIVNACFQLHWLNLWCFPCQYGAYEHQSKLKIYKICRVWNASM